MDQALNALSAVERTAFEARFREEYRDNVLYHKWGEQGLDYPVIRSLFRGYAYRELLTPLTEEMIEPYVRQRMGDTSSRAEAA